MTKLKHDKKLEISTGSHAFTRNWTKLDVSWSQLLKKLSRTVRTSETVEQYKRMGNEGKDGVRKQASIKDIGGFVGGVLAGGKRGKNSVVYRSLLSLDIDHAEGEDSAAIWESFKMMYDSAAAVYSTHKHTPDSPRLRLVIPLSRDVSPAEYIPIGRKIAENIGINLFDRTTYQPERLMFWPSTSKNGKFYFNYNDSDFLDPDTVLNEYADWQDVSSWPLSDQEKEIVQTNLTKQQDPSTKQGLIGAFCRTYDIHAAILKFLPDTYTRSELDPSRYTYIHGSTFNGLVTYEDKFAYSHHSTDPTGNITCNAFDLVRIHLFGDRDSGDLSTKKTTTLESYKAMKELCASDKDVKKQLGKERIAKAFEGFDLEYNDGDLERGFAAYSDNLDKGSKKEKRGPAPLKDEALTPVEIVDNLDWMKGLAVDEKTSAYLATIDNFVLIFSNDPVFRGKIAEDQFSHRAVALGPLAWRNKDRNVFTDPYEGRATFSDLLNIIPDTNRYINDNDEANIRWYLQKTYQLPIIKSNIDDALNIVIGKKGFHPIKQYLNGLEWDGEPRIEFIFSDYLGAANTEYIRTVTRKFFAAAVARVFTPGCKFDFMPVLVGEQGINKSSVTKVMGALWFSDSLFTMAGKDGMEQLQGSWIIEVAELSAMKHSEVEGVKHFVSRQVDRFRVAFGRRTEDFPRQCVFIGTCNKQAFLKDVSGDRRFWPIPVQRFKRRRDITKDFTMEIRNQLWAEAVHYWKAGEKLYLSDALEAKAKEMQKQHTIKDERANIVLEYLNTPVPLDWDNMNPFDRRNWYQDYCNGTPNIAEGVLLRDNICTVAIMIELFNFGMNQISPYSTRPFNDMLATLEGFKADSVKRFVWYGRQNSFSRI